MNEKQKTRRVTLDRVRSVALILTEVIGACAITTGVALVSVPAAFIVGGVLLIIGSEFAA